MAAATSKPKKAYPARKKCNRCGRRRTTSPVVVTPRGGRRAGKFRILSSGYLQGMCIDCERVYESDRWPHRSPASRRIAA